MKNVLFILFMLVAFLFGAVDFNSATKEELMDIKGIGEKKAEAIIEYRKTNKINSVEDLEAIKGFGPGLIEKIKNSNK
ncbi:ComEA family DNA-binding protein [Halarcobacter ebronensis]|uniref:DNA-binding protein n=1 Tax=Halarcobacter ebronensis TaxID=1462615 RepID=A0A4Q1AR30_9BACT|nr:helix-hairpin-helix domain-containing protein [Halarcobacter ebronensis]QKF83447.1 competence protein, ComEA family [Halarcobacter ebronensis]RXK08247.1 DNA-binding protein [Halarcobacter ebronensis]